MQDLTNMKARIGKKLVRRGFIAATIMLAVPLSFAFSQGTPALSGPIILHAARLLDIEAGRSLRPGEILVRGDKIAEAGTAVAHPAGAEVINLGDTTLMPGLIDAHV